MKINEHSLFELFQLAILNKRLLSIKVPDSITRLPRKLDERQHWKGDEIA